MSNIHNRNGHTEMGGRMTGDNKEKELEIKLSLEQLRNFIDGIDTSGMIEAENFKQEMEQILKDKGEDAFGFMQRALKKYLDKSGGGDYQPPRQLQVDFSNISSNYNRINFLEVLVSFNYNRDNALKHWRISKIMDGITLCSKEFGICEGLSPTDVEEKIYNVIKSGKANEKTWDVEVEDPENEKKIKYKASLADFAQFGDIYELNKSVGDNRVPYKTLIYNFFSGKENFEVEKDMGGEKIKLNLKKQVQRDDFSDIDIDDFLKKVKEHRAGFELLESFRYISENHRENGGHAFRVPMADGSSIIIPISGRMAAEVTAADMRKSTKGVAGHPHEVGDLSEETGTMVRFRYHDLKTNRRDVSEVNKHSQTNPRFARMAMGLNSDGTDMEMEENAVLNKKVIYLGGKIGEKGDVPSLMVAGMHAHHDKIRQLTGLKKLTDKEASDMFMTDVLAPMFLNNDNDWLMCLASVYNVSGTRSAANKKAGILSKKKDNDVWEDFQINIVCKNVEKAGEPIETMTFMSFKQLKDYILARFNLGHIDQKIDLKLVTLADEEVKSKYKSKDILNSTELNAAQVLLTTVFGSEYKTIIGKYSKSENPENLEIKTKIGSSNGLVRAVFFNQLLTEALTELKNSDMVALSTNLNEFLSVGIDIDDEEDITNAIGAFVESMLSLSKDDRKKFK